MTNKSDYKQAFEMACALLRDSIDCGGCCPFIKSGKSGDVACDEKETRENYIMEKVSIE